MSWPLLLLKVQKYNNQDRSKADSFLTPSAFASQQPAVSCLPARWSLLLDSPKTQVKLRGYRIELQEIESALVEQPGITAAVCCILKDTQGQARLVAYAEPCNAAAAASLDRLALHGSLSKRLPTYMIPDVLVVMEALPRLSNEKLNRKALPEPDWSADALGAAAAAAAGGSNGNSSGPKFTARQLAADSVLEAVVAAWGQALGMSPLALGPKSDFMALGGNSLQAGLMAAAVRKTLQLPRLSGLLIYSHSQLGGFVAEVKQQAKAASAAAAAAKASTALSIPESDSHGLSSPKIKALAASSSSSASSGSSSDTAGLKDLTSCNSCGSSGSMHAGGCTGRRHRACALPLWLASLLQLLAAAMCSGIQLAFNLAPILTVQIVMAHMNEWTALAFIPVAKVVTLISEWCVL